MKALWLYGRKLHLAGSAGTTAVMATVNNAEAYIGADVNHDWITAGLISYQAATSVRKRMNVHENLCMTLLLLQYSFGRFGRRSVVAEFGSAPQ